MRNPPFWGLADFYGGFLYVNQPPNFIYLGKPYNTSLDKKQQKTRYF